MTAPHPMTIEGRRVPHIRKQDIDGVELVEKEKGNEKETH